MKIELKKIDFSERLSEETYCFAADIWIDGVKVGYAQNNGHGGATSYQSFDEKGKALIRSAEAYCKSLPTEEWDADGETKSLPMDLEIYIDNLLEKYLEKLHIQKIQSQINRYSKNSIVVGIPTKTLNKYTFKNQTIDKILAQSRGFTTLANFIRSIVKPELQEGEKILNTNIPMAVYKLAGLNENDYIAKQHPLKMMGKKSKSGSLKR